MSELGLGVYRGKVDGREETRTKFSNYNFLKNFVDSIPEEEKSRFNKFFGKVSVDGWNEFLIETPEGWEEFIEERTNFFNSPSYLEADAAAELEIAAAKAATIVDAVTEEIPSFIIAEYEGRTEVAGIEIIHQEADSEEDAKKMTKKNINLADYTAPAGYRKKITRKVYQDRYCNWVGLLAVEYIEI